MVASVADGHLVLDAGTWATMAPPHGSTADAQSKPSGSVDPLECGEPTEAKACHRASWEWRVATPRSRPFRPSAPQVDVEDDEVRSADGADGDVAQPVDRVRLLGLRGGDGQQLQQRRGLGGVYLGSRGCTSIR